MTDWSEETPTPELVKGMITVPEVAELYGLEPNSSGKIPSFDNPEERTPSLHLYQGDGGWYDFSCGKGGDVIDFVMAAEKCTFNQALWRLWNKSLRAGREPGDVERSVPKEIVDFTTQLPGLDTGAVSEWGQRLGVAVPWSCRTLDGNLLIPHADQDGVYGVKVREPGGAKSAWPGSQFVKRLYDPFGWAPGREACNGICVITEGETDAWSLVSYWPNVYALPSGAGAWRDHWLEDLKQFDTVYLAMDNDRAGKEALSKLLAKIPNSKTFQVPQLAKDVREALAMFPNWNPGEQLVQ